MYSFLYGLLLMFIKMYAILEIFFPIKRYQRILLGKIREKYRINTCHC